MRFTRQLGLAALVAPAAAWGQGTSQERTLSGRAPVFQEEALAFLGSEWKPR